MLFKFAIFLLLASSCIFYLKYTEDIFKLCRKSAMDENFLNKLIAKGIKEEFLNSDKNIYGGPQISNIAFNKKIEIIQNSCKDFYVDYYSHTAMKFTIGMIFDYVYDLNEDNINKLNDEKTVNYNNPNYDEKTFIYYLHNLDLHNFQFSLYAIKFIHLFLYSSMLYVIVISFPNIAAQFILFLVNRILLIIFVAFLFEGLFRFYFKLDTNLINIFDKESYSKILNLFQLSWILDPLKFVIDLININKYF